MKLHSYYLKLHSYYGGPAEQSVTLDELAAVLGCTHRNAQHLVTKMSGMGWIVWSHARGRGRRSSLRFLADPEQLALQSMQQTISRKELHNVLDDVRIHTSAASLQGALHSWMMGYFGHHTKRSRDKRIDTLRLPISQQLHTLDPLQMNLLAESFVTSHLYDGLVARGASPGEIVPALAHAWDIGCGGQEWTFYLRKEIWFHHGRVLTAPDVVYTFERMLGSGSGRLYSHIIREIAEVKALDSLTVQFKLKNPCGLFLPFLCTSRAAIVPGDLQDIPDPFTRRAVGTGPFKLAEFTGESCVLEAFSGHYRSRAHLDRVEIVCMPWISAHTLQESTPFFHVLPNPPEDQSASWSRMQTGSSIRKFVTCNSMKPGPLQDSGFREELFRRLAGAADQPAAAECSAQTGAAASRPLEIATIPQYRQDAERIAASLEQYGYPCEVLAVPPHEFKGSRRLQADLIVFSLLRDQDEELRKYDLYATLAGHIEPVARSFVEAQLRQIAAEQDACRRAAAFAAIEELLIREHQLYILYEKPGETAYLPKVRGVSFNSQGWIDLRQLWFPPEEENRPS